MTDESTYVIDSIVYVSASPPLPPWLLTADQETNLLTESRKRILNRKPAELEDES